MAESAAAQARPSFGHRRNVVNDIVRSGGVSGERRETGQVVEDGQVRDILARPFHPYTAGLLGSIPQAARRKTVLSSIPGRVPAVGEMPAGCRFEPRCTYAEPRCRAPQELVENREARHVRCCRFGEFVLTGAA